VSDTPSVPPSEPLPDELGGALRRYLDGQRRIRSAHHVGSESGVHGARVGATHELRLGFRGGQPSGAERAALSYGLMRELSAALGPGELSRYGLSVRCSWERKPPVDHGSSLLGRSPAKPAAELDPLLFEFRWEPLAAPEGLSQTPRTALAPMPVEVAYLSTEHLVKNGRDVCSYPRLHLDVDRTLPGNSPDLPRRVHQVARPFLEGLAVGVVVPEEARTRSTVVFRRSDG
jgi:hypothetical protein